MLDYVKVALYYVQLLNVLLIELAFFNAALLTVELFKVALF